MKVSACVITKNEEKNIEKCLASYRKVVNEIILVDTGSNDRTIEIAKSFGAKIFYYKWNNDFAAAKNFALSKASGQWIIFLDADEYFDELSSDRLIPILKSAESKVYNAIGCELINIDSDHQNKIIESFMKVRIFKNDKNIRYYGNVHETIQKKKGKINVLALCDKIHIYHTGYSSNLVKRKGERNLKILWENIQKNGEDPNYYRYLADCYLALGEYDESIKYSRMEIQSEKILYKSKAYKNIIDALTLKKAPNLQIEAEIKMAIKAFPDHANFYYVYGEFLLKQRRYNQALQNLLQVVSLFTHESNDINFAIGKMKDVYRQIGLLYQLQNEELIALDYYLKALQEDKYNVFIFRSIPGICNRVGSVKVLHSLKEVYRETCEADISFLLKELQYLACNEIYIYYVNVWQRQFGRNDYSIAMGLLLQGSYERVFEALYKDEGEQTDKREKICLAVAAVIASQNKENLAKLLSKADPSLQVLLQRCCGVPIKLDSMAWEWYLSILLKLVLLKNPYNFECFFLLIKEASPEFMVRAAVELVSKQSYEAAIRIFHEYFAKCKTMAIKSATDIYINLGYCHYKLREYDVANQYFAEAIAQGYDQQDVHEFMQWIRKLKCL